MAKPFYLLFVCKVKGKGQLFIFCELQNELIFIGPSRLNSSYPLVTSQLPAANSGISGAQLF